MAIPMPGHPVPSQEESNILNDCRRLWDLINSHDAIFLLTDTRESRWLPSLLGASANKVLHTFTFSCEVSETSMLHVIMYSQVPAKFLLD